MCLFFIVCVHMFYRLIEELIELRGVSGTKLDRIDTSVKNKNSHRYLSKKLKLRKTGIFTQNKFLIKSILFYRSVRQISSYTRI